jgi:UDP-N-acetylmuramoyl-L-alanyl-D-glutamate--2,6-diaminopimelate ligase
LKILKNNFFITDDSRECDKNSFFLSDFNSKKYEDIAKKKCKEVIYPANLHNFFDIKSIKIIGITGTNGKTTTAALIYSLLLDLGKKVALLGTRGFFINDARISQKTLTTPPLLELMNKIQMAQDEGCEFFVMEVSSHAIAQKELKD